MFKLDDMGVLNEERSTETKACTCSCLSLCFSLSGIAVKQHDLRKGKKRERGDMLSVSYKEREACI